jgi:anti-anti-sigma factor
MDRAMPDSTQRPRLTVDVRHTSGGAVVVPAGELDHHSAPTLSDTLHACVDEGRARIVVDCTGLEFCDSTGLNVLLAARLAAEAAGGRVHLAGMRPIVARVLEITGADAVFPVHDTVDDALAALPAE